MTFAVTNNFTNGTVANATEVNQNFTDVEDEFNNNVLDYVVKHEYQDSTATASTSTSYATVKTHTITGGTYSQGFWVFASGNIRSTGSANGGAQITIGGTQKVEMVIRILSIGEITIVPWTICCYVDSSDAQWTPASDIDVDIDVKMSGTSPTSSTDNFFIFGR